jgi:methylthioribose-1-phosphate isomerase
MMDQGTFSPIRFDGEHLELIDQLALPTDERWVRCRDAEEAARAISDMVVRGAPAIGITAAYGVAMATGDWGVESEAAVRDRLAPILERLARTRPTAVNLFWALEEMKECAARAARAGEAVGPALRQRAVEIHEDDIAMCRAMGAHGAALLPDRVCVLTHCNAGALATGGYGTALGVIRAAVEAGKTVRVFADETRPYLQGSRLTAWELARDGIDVTIIPDSAAAFLMARGEVDCCVTGADRIAANGDVANKIGTYSVALAAREAGIPFYVAAPVSTLDLDTASGAEIPIEERSQDEVLFVKGQRLGPEGVAARNPAFDVTPAALVSAIITNQGVARAPYAESLAALTRD